MKNVFQEIPKLNIKRSNGRSIATIILIAVLAFSLFMTAFLGLSMRSGLNVLEQRLGSDIIVIPEEAEEFYEGSILKGEPSAFYLDNQVLAEVANMDQVAAVSPQLYIASLEASCCAYPVQLVGIDAETDFVVKPWLQEQGSVEQLGKREILVGSNLTSEVGSTVQFFNQEFTVVGNMDETGMGYDNSAFMSLEDARELAKIANDYDVQAKTKQDNSVSAIMVDVKDTADKNLSSTAIDISQDIRDQGAKAKVSTDFIAGTANQIKGTSTYIYILLAIVWIVCIVVLLIVFPMIVKARSKDLTVIRILGATKKQIAQTLLKEVLALSVIGAVCGTAFGIMIAWLFGNSIQYSLAIPFLAPSVFTMALVTVVVLAICAFIGPLISLLSINQLNKKEIAIASAENN